MDFQVLLKVEEFVIKELFFFFPSNFTVTLWILMACQVKLVPPLQRNKWCLRAPNGLTTTHVFSYVAAVIAIKTGCKLLFFETPLR